MAGPAAPLTSAMSVAADTLPAMDMKLEVVSVPVTDVDRAKAFYVDQVGFLADHDHQVNEKSALRPAHPARLCLLGGDRHRPHRDDAGHPEGPDVVIADAAAARELLLGRGVEASEVDVQPWGSFVYFADPDGNTWALQQLPARG